MENGKTFPSLPRQKFFFFLFFSFWHRFYYYYYYFFNAAIFHHHGIFFPMLKDFFTPFFMRWCKRMNWEGGWVWKDGCNVSSISLGFKGLLCNWSFKLSCIQRIIRSFFTFFFKKNSTKNISFKLTYLYYLLNPTTTSPNHPHFLSSSSLCRCVVLFFF